MIRLIIFRFWPALLPLIVYFIWHGLAVNRAKKNAAPVPRFRDGPIYWTVLFSLLMGVLCFIVLAFGQAAEKGKYVPPAVKNGRVIQGHIQR
jgi:hypothetical protein